MKKCNRRQQKHEKLHSMHLELSETYKMFASIIISSEKKKATYRLLQNSKAFCGDRKIKIYLSISKLNSLVAISKVLCPPMFTFLADTYGYDRFEVNS